MLIQIDQGWLPLRDTDNPAGAVVEAVALDLVKDLDQVLATGQVLDQEWVWARRQAWETVME